ncbi:MAG TPA: nuclear transport factor 2 family protein [Solirubrobacterales bacterium]|nr:nuclear transport factor 2 family protein [Solirubrobacterales bacterium]
MSEENLSALKRLYERWATGDWTDTSFIDAHLVAVLPDPSPRVFYGAEAVAEYTRQFLEPWEEISVQADDFRGSENTYVVGVQIQGTGSASGVELADRLFHVWTFRGRTAIRFDVFDNEPEALAAAGLSD